MVSLLLDHGHPQASEYPVGMLWDEADLVVERVNSRLSTEAVLIQLAAASVMSKDALKQFNKIVKRLSDG